MRQVKVTRYKAAFEAAFADRHLDKDTAGLEDGVKLEVMARHRGQCRRSILVQRENCRRCPLPAIKIEGSTLGVAKNRDQQGAAVETTQISAQLVFNLTDQVVEEHSAIALSLDLP